MRSPSLQGARAPLFQLQEPESRREALAGLSGGRAPVYLLASLFSDASARWPRLWSSLLLSSAPFPGGGLAWLCRGSLVLPCLGDPLSVSLSVGALLLGPCRSHPISPPMYARD